MAIQAGHGNTDLLYSTYGHPDEPKALRRLLDLDAVEEGITDEDLRRLTAGE